MNIHENFKVLEVDPDGKKFDKVSRVVAHGDLYDFDLVLDVNVDLYPVQAGDSLSLTLVSTLNQDGSGMPVGDPGQQVYDPSVPFRSTNADDYEYVMFGKVFKYKDARRKGGSDTVNAEVFASFGGLLMHLSGTPDRLKELDVDQSLYLMIRKVA